MITQTGYAAPYRVNRRSAALRYPCRSADAQHLHPVRIRPDGAVSGCGLLSRSQRCSWKSLPGAIDLARAQFALTVVWHFLFPAFTIGLASYLAVLEACWLADPRMSISTPIATG